MNDQSDPQESMQDGFDLQSKNSNQSLIFNFNRKISASSIKSRQSMNELFDMQSFNSKSVSFPINLQEEDSINRFENISNYGRDVESIEENEKIFDQIHTKQYKLNKKAGHQCICPKQNCNKQLCSCYLFNDEPCIVGLCCSKCVAHKNKIFLLKSQEYKQFLKQKRLKLIAFHKQRKTVSVKKGHKQKVQRTKYNFLSCTCKKTHCMKKYCPCYAMNRQCNQCCICEQCQNHSDDESNTQQLNQLIKQNKQLKQHFKQNASESSYENIESKSKSDEKQLENSEIDNYFEYYPEDFSGIQMNVEMLFEPVNFEEYAIKNSQMAPR